MKDDRSPLVLSVFSTFAIGGPQVRFVTLANRLGPAFRHAIIAMDGAMDCAARLAPGLDVSFPDVSIRKGDTLGNVWRFRQALRRIRPDVLVTYNWGTIEWAIANALLPVVRHVHIEDGFGPEEREAQIPRRVMIRRAVLRWPTVVVPSRTLWRIAVEGWRLPETQLRYVPNGIDLTRFAPSRHASGEAIIIGTVASLRTEKNLARLLRSFRLLPETAKAKLVVVGDGPEREALEATASELGLARRVHFTGQAEDPSPLYAGFDIFALSSDTEQMPLSLLEAMAAGLPAVSTAVGDVRNMLAEENAPFVVPLEDTALADAMLRLIKDEALRRQIGTANRAKAERDYDERVMVEAYKELFAVHT